MTTQDARPIKIEVKNLTKRFGDLLVLDDMNFTIRKGEFLAIVGPTGCGKTTFLNCLSKLMPTSEGDIYIDGEPANPQKHNISFVFQEPTCFPWRTVRENVAYGMEIKRWDKKLIEGKPPNSTLIRFPRAWCSASPWPAPSPSSRTCS